MRFSKPLFSVFTGILIMIACNKKNAETLTISTTDFVASKTLSYSYDSIYFKAVDSTSATPYRFDFGDGNFTSGSFKTSHVYTRGGAYTVTMTVEGKATSKTIQVRPGVLSYQVRNSSNRTLDIMTYADNYTNGSLFRKEYYKNTLGDTLWFAHPQVTGNLMHLLGMSIFVSNKEYLLPDVIWAREKAHTIIEIKDSTIVKARISYGGVNPGIYIKDL